MFYELLIGFGVLVYFVWRYVLSAKKDAKDAVQETKAVVQDVVQTGHIISLSDREPLIEPLKQPEPLIRSVTKAEEKLLTSSECPHVPNNVEHQFKVSALKNSFEAGKITDKSPLRTKNIDKYFNNNSSAKETFENKTEKLIRNSKNPEEWAQDLKKYFKTDNKDASSTLSSEIIKTKDKLPKCDLSPKVVNDDVVVNKVAEYFKNDVDTKQKPVGKQLVIKSKPAEKHPTLGDFFRVQNEITIEPIVIHLNSVSREREISDLFDKNDTRPESTDSESEAEKLFNDLHLETDCTEKVQTLKDTFQTTEQQTELFNRQYENSNEKNGKRESPPKERFAEFLEKTILSEDKIQSIIQNLSLDTAEIIEQEPRKSNVENVNGDGDTISDSSLQSQASVDEVANIESINNNAYKENGSVFADSFLQEEKPRQLLPDREEKSTIQDFEFGSIDDEPKPLQDSEIDGNVNEKPLLKFIQKQSGFPTGLNFGSVIGELKSKTKNGGLKPVFKKFESLDTDDDVQETLNAAVDEKKKVVIEDTELEANILADRRTKLETAAQGWRKRVPQSDASLFTVAGRLERDKVNVTPPRTPPPNTPPPTPAVAPVTPATPGIPAPNKFRSRKQNSPTNGFASGPLRSASCAIVSQAAETKPKESPRHDRESFKRSHSVSESISRLDEDEESSPGPEKTGCPVRVPRADDETFQAFFAPVLQQEKPAADVDVDLDAIDSGHRQLLASEWARRAKRERKHAASRNPLRALAARTDIRDEYVAPPSALREQLVKEKATANCGLAASALAALASKEDFASVALRSASGSNVPAQGTRSLMLMQVKGRRRVQTRLVEPVHTNVNRGDCFILATPDHVFLYIGLYANVIERNRSIDIANHIHNTKDLGCKSSTMVTIIDEQIKKYSNKHWSQFWSLLGLADGIEDYRPAETGHPDEDEIYESCIVQTNMCYEVADDELVPIKEYWGQIPKISMLHQSKTIVFDFGSEMYIWYGKNVPLETRRRAAQLAQELFDEGYNYEECHINPLNAAEYQGARELNENSYKSAKTRPDWAIFSKVTQHMETILFKEKFLDWPDYSRIIKVKPQESKTNSTEITPCDAEEMWSNEYLDPDLILEGSHLGRGTEYSDKESMRHFNISTQSVTKWIIQEYDFQKVENDAEIPEFFSGDSYIIRWDYLVTVSGRELNGKPSKHNVTGRDRCAYFCWQGKDASSNEKGAAALLTVELDREKGPQVRVAQGNEPAAFLNLFQGNLVIHQGKRDTDKSRFKLFVTRGNLTNEAYLLQVPCSVRQLRSRGSLLLVDTEKGCLYIWHGARSMKHTKNIAIELANKLIARKSTYLFGNNVSVDITEVKEGEEPKEVLEALGVANKQHYSSVLNGGKDCADVTPRLFHFTDLSGQFEAHEVLSPLRHERLVTPFPFEQKELYSASQPALFLLDDGVHVWLWQGWWPRGEDGELEPAERCFGVGSFAARWQALRAAALRTAEAYWRAARPGTERPDVRVVAAGLEPQAFTALFDTWTEHDEAADANIAHGYKSGEVLSGAVELSRLTAAAAVLPLAALQRRPLPDHVDGAHLERHLSSPDFLEAFGMTKEEFTGLPAWKQTNLKKDVGLF